MGFFLLCSVNMVNYIIFYCIIDTSLVSLYEPLVMGVLVFQCAPGFLLFAFIFMSKILWFFFCACSPSSVFGIMLCWLYIKKLAAFILNAIEIAMESSVLWRFGIIYLWNFLVVVIFWSVVLLIFFSKCSLLISLLRLSWFSWVLLFSKLLRTEQSALS